MTEVIKSDVVELDYNDLVAGADLTSQIQKAYGVDGVGLLTVKNVPQYVAARSRLLPLSKKFADLPDEVKEKYVHKESYYSFGWSHGKEKLQGKPDVSKGSYYANPQYDRPVEDPELIAKHASFVHPNIWPQEELPDLEHAFKDLGQIIVGVGKLVAQQCDRYVRSKCETYPERLLEKTIDTSLCCKARLLHYFPIATSEEPESADKEYDFSSWCGWHNDHGSLTGLTCALYLDADGNQVVNTDPTAGLYVRNRNSQLIHATIPVDSIAFQIGETAQVHSGGLLQATPHAVRGSKMVNVSRETFAVFMEPMWMDPMAIPEGVDPQQAQSQTAAANLPPGVPALKTRWEHRADPSQAPQTFGEFSEKTHQSYY
eukprot:gene27302-30860_t